MSASSYYIDTSALAKWYLEETLSDEFSHWIQHVDRAVISGLTITEMRCLLARKRRMKEISELDEQNILRTFQGDIEQGHLVCAELDGTCFEAGAHIIGQIPHIPLRSLDAIHLAIAQQLSFEGIATADLIFSRAADELGFDVTQFADD